MGSEITGLFLKLPVMKIYRNLCIKSLRPLQSRNITQKLTTAVENSLFNSITWASAHTRHSYTCAHGTRIKPFFVI